MKIKYLMLFTIPLALIACQNNEAPGTPTQPMASPASNSGNAVEVKKPLQSSTAKAMQQTVQAAKQQAAATIEQLTGKAEVPARPNTKSKAESTPMKEKQAAVESKPSVAAAQKLAPKAPPVVKQANTSEPVKKAVAKAVEKAPVAEVAKPVAAAPLSGDAGKGQALARKCKACHNFTAKKKVGPGLAAIFGRKAGTMPDMRYSKSLATGGWVWDDAHLAAWVCNSKKAIKTFSGDNGAKTKMGNQKICDPAKQADLIAYLKTL